MAVRRVLPNSVAANYNALVTASINSEGLVNGVWNSYVSFATCSISLKLTVELMPRILNQDGRLPTDAAIWSINPEVRTTGGGFIDLFITRNTFNPFVMHPTIIYEGKANGGATWDNILTQVLGYAQTFVTRNGQFIYMIGAMGSGCRFFRYKRGDAIPATCMAFDARSRTVSFLDSGRATTYNILTDAGQTAVCFFIDKILAEPTPLLHNAVEFDTEHADVQAAVEVDEVSK